MLSFSKNFGLRDINIIELDHLRWWIWDSHFYSYSTISLPDFVREKVNNFTVYDTWKIELVEGKDEGDRIFKISCAELH